MGCSLIVNLPELITIEQLDGQWERYLSHIYQVFINSIVDTKLEFLSKPIRCRWHPSHDRKHFSFWHIISETGNEKDEGSRIPSMRRCERIAWIGHVISNVNNFNDIWCWENERTTNRGSSRHTILYLHSQRYVVVLKERSDCYLLVTAYLIEQEHRHLKLLKEKGKCVDPRKDRGRH